MNKKSILAIVLITCFVFGIMMVSAYGLKLVPGKVWSLGKAKKAQAWTPSDIGTIIASINADKMYNIMADLSNPAGLAINGRWAGENQDVENYVAASFETVAHLTFEADKGFKQPFDYLYTKCTNATITLYRKYPSGTFEAVLPNLPKLGVDWNECDENGITSGSPYIKDSARHPLALFDEWGNKIPGRWVDREPVAGIDYVVPGRAGSAALSKAEFVNIGKSNKNITQQKVGDKIVLDPSYYSGGDFDSCSLANQHGAKGYITRATSTAVSTLELTFPLTKQLVLAIWDRGYLTQNLSGEVFNGFAQIMVSQYLFDVLANEGYLADINIIAENVPNRQINNIIGEIPGDPASSVSREVVIIGSHFDGQGTQPGGIIYPSAIDNASGVAAMMEIARVFNDYFKTNNLKPKRTIRFISFNAEELGLAGAAAYVNNLSADERSRIVAYLNLDGVGGDLDFRTAMSIDNTISKYSNLKDALSKAVIDAQLDVCLLLNYTYSTITKPKVGELCYGKSLQVVEVDHPSGVTSINLLEKSGWYDYLAFWNYNISNLNFGTFSLVGYMAHTPYDNINAYHKTRWHTYWPITTKVIAATALELALF